MIYPKVANILLLFFNVANSYLRSRNTGTQENSRFEFSSLNGRYKDEYDLQIDIQTLNAEGIVFYSSDLSKRDLIAVFIQDGRVREETYFIKSFYRHFRPYIMNKSMHY